MCQHDSRIHEYYRIKTTKRRNSRRQS
ncbi:hypothetical protein LRO45_002134 [Listeria monocytogenes]|uniref:Uncharacterized protein n=2 Tax=Listeria monocytogenes TaxID=1639 RepID=A0A5D5UB99_LISMN|nr:hypothetical protein EGX77_09835 [Listeria monocytogenes]EAF4457869.1 hypothetical protein [Listeria monocytogenes serotype 1/2a]EEP3929568.1 hypothetical protein [Listeria monocytogenes serotype 4ab]MCY62102.1 hypothetical protein [Listeria monocytogenes serotype 4c]MDA18315.1 hypothetical protein [Listeria monocytogenes serotype 4a]